MIVKELNELFASLHPNLITRAEVDARGEEHEVHIWYAIQDDDCDTLGNGAYTWARALIKAEQAIINGKEGVKIACIDNDSKDCLREFDVMQIRDWLIVANMVQEKPQEVEENV